MFIPPMPPFACAASVLNGLMRLERKGGSMPKSAFAWLMKAWVRSSNEGEWEMPEGCWKR